MLRTKYLKSMSLMLIVPRTYIRARFNVETDLQSQKNRDKKNIVMQTKGIDLIEIPYNCNLLPYINIRNASVIYLRNKDINVLQI